MQQAVIITDLGYGDSGKGTVTDALVRRHDAKYVVRYNGGPQAAHNVHTSNGRHHTFRQFGSGTFAGAHTILGPQALFEPIHLLNEANQLRCKDVDEPLKLIHISKGCRMLTPWLAALGSLREVGRSNPHGSTGFGVGEGVRLAVTHPEVAMYAFDIASQTFDYFEQKLAHHRDVLEELCTAIIEELGLMGDHVDRIMSMFDQSRWNDWMNSYYRIGSEVKFDDGIYNLRDCGGTVIFEGAQGVLLDQQHGFHPHTTWSDTTDRHAFNLAVDCLGFHRRIHVKTVGVIRSYMTRHGNGPFPTELNKTSEQMTLAMKLFADEDNPTGTYQGSMRAGYLDLAAIRYAASKCRSLSELAITHMDKVPLLEEYGNLVCTGYNEVDLAGYKCTEEASIQARRFTRQFQKATPQYVKPEGTFVEWIGRKIGLPVTLQSFGKTERDKKYGSIS